MDLRGEYSKTIVVQQDYIHRGQSAFSRRQKTNSRKKQSSLLFISPMIAAITTIMLMAFISGLCFIAHHKKGESKTLQVNKVTGNDLPPKPEERWRYIKELENRQLSACASIQSSANNEVNLNQKLTEEHRPLLTQLRVDDMHQRLTQLNEVPRNQQILVQCQTKIQQQWPQIQFVQKSKAQPYQKRQQQTCMAKSKSIQKKEKAQQITPVTKSANALEQTEKKKDKCYWIVQCGSFKGVKQAKSARAKLACEGFNPYIITNNGWNRVLIGPVKSKGNADVTIARLKVAGHTNCIRLASRG